jgi:two-component system NtrC family response regulator
VGGKKELESHFCLIAATNRNLDDMVLQNQFRDDLLYRLRTIEIPLPPLRNHKEDIKALSQHYVAKLCLQYETATKGFTPEFFGVAEEYDWPGNVRELNQALEKAIASAGSGPLLYPKDLPIEIRAKMARDSISISTSEDDVSVYASDMPFPTLDEVRAKAVLDSEREYLHRVMAYAQRDIPKAIDLSGLSRARFYALLKKHDISTSIRPHRRK